MLVCILCFVDFRETPSSGGGCYGQATESREGEVQGEYIQSHRNAFVLKKSKNLW